MSAKNRFSVILVTCNRYHVAKANVEGILKQTYSDYELIVCDDSDKDYAKKESGEFQKFLKDKGRYIYTARFDRDGNKDYGLARARNFGVIEATGEYVMFLDDRITPAKPDVINVFRNALEGAKKLWVFGDKGAHKSAFVENFSAVRRCELVDAGLFLERIDKYGAMTREIIARFSRQGFEFRYLPEAVASQVCKSGGWEKKDKEIPEMRNFLVKLFAR